MALLDKWDDLRGKATEIMQSGVAIAKLKTDNMAEEDAMRRAYLAIGKIYFERYGDAPDDALAAECARIRACQLRIAENNLRLAQMKDDVAQATSNTTATSESPTYDPDTPVQPNTDPCEDCESSESKSKEPDTIPQEKEESPTDQ